MKQIDITHLPAKEAAQKLYEWCCELSKKDGQNPEIEVRLLAPDRSKELGYGECWRVMWESGPFEWAVALSNGGTAFGPENNDYSYKKPPEVILWKDGPNEGGWFAEPYYSFDIGFIED